eukprot:14094336-Ditylum_brightwellii.AAC.1
MLIAPSSGIPIIWSLYLRDFFNSIAILSATNSDPNVGVSTVFWHLEYHAMGALLRNINIP